MKILINESHILKVADFIVLERGALVFFNCRICRNLFGDFEDMRVL